MKEVGNIFNFYDNCYDECEYVEEDEIRQAYYKNSPYGKYVKESKEQQNSFDNFFSLHGYVATITSGSPCFEDLKSLPPFFEHVEEFTVFEGIEDDDEITVIVYHPYKSNVDSKEELIDKIQEWASYNSLLFGDYGSIRLYEDSWYSKDCYRVEIIPFRMTPELNYEDPDHTIVSVDNEDFYDEDFDEEDF